MRGWFIVWIVVTQCVNFAFYLKVTRVAYGWVRTLAAYAVCFLLPLVVSLFCADPSLHGSESGAAGELPVGYPAFFAVWCAVTMAMSRGSPGRRLFAVLVCGVHQIGAFTFGLMAMCRLEPQPLGVAVACILMGGMGLFLVRRGLSCVMRMYDAAGWGPLNLTAAMNFALLFVTGIWPVYAPTGSPSEVAVFVVANVVAIVYFPVCHAFTEKNRMERALRMAEDNTRVILAELKSARAVEEGARRVRHDARHHVNVVRGMLASGRVKELDEYLANMGRNEFLSTIGSNRWCENPLVDALFAVADAKAAACGKKLKATAAVATDLPFDETDIVALVGNLLENAIRYGTGNEVSASVMLERGIFRLMVANGVRPGFALEKGFPSPDGGVGLLSVRQVVEKHHGLIGFEVKGDELVCKVVIGCA